MTITKKDLQEALKAQTQNFDQKLDEQTNALAQVVNSAFQDEHDYMEKQFGKIDQRFDTVQDHLHLDDRKLDRALYIETIHLEERIKRLEKHVGIKAADVLLSFR